MLKNDMEKKDQKTRTVKEVMTEVYKENLWGGKNEPFYSGSGSHKQKIVEPYILAVTKWLASLDEKLVVCDLGCGDFNVGRQLVSYSKEYVGIDVVDALIQRNQTLFKGDKLMFECLDIIQEKLPEGDCAIVRQVLQHLSNEEILMLMPKLREYRFLVVTEHLPFAEFVPNIDKPTDYDIRLRKKSGVVLTEAPFDLKPLKEKKLLTIGFRQRSQITTTLYQNF
ncbi:class I SAM-dependent methyltransferase [uncultured Kriegella sp.]|uniref:class I SAM-dependent methyltransferase n=1 Tax=uncultured Kriegella sp. TaxID=1798910 RepID=UPI0030D7C917|tara:strand:+ start:50018 stop:50689 length:672 start_codon:yes stop_codon:yes gene_type:complete